MRNGSRAEEARGRTRAGDIKEEMSTSGTNTPKSFTRKSSSSSPVKSLKSTPSPDMDAEKKEEIVGGEITVKLEPGKPPKLSRSSSQKITSRPAPLFDEYPDHTDEAKSAFQVIPECIYSNKFIGSTEHGMECDCADEWDASTKLNLACGEDSDCINRATKIECFGDCGCGPDCQNQRFQQQHFASVTVIKTEKKGYGLRADTDLQPNEFIFEYIGEVIGEAQFRRRMVQYDEEGIKHFYFMSLTKGEFVDATKKGNLGRFCNHSCNPNCYVDKWVVGDKLRMGIFAERNIKSGEELVFNYNVDRYGADPQPCYCGEPNCTGFIGGKTQTERATKLSNLTIEALGIDDGDGWDTAVAKKPRKKKVGEDDEEYVNNVQPRSLDEDGVTKVMATLMQCKEKWIAVKLLGRIQHCDDERVRNRVVKMHGYQILNSTLILWMEDANVVLQILDILEQFPRLTRNKISDSKIETTVESLKSCGDGRVESQAEALLTEWSTLEVAYRIPRRKREINSTVTPDKPDRLARRDSDPKERKARSNSRSRPRSRSRSKSIDAPRGPAAPSGPRGSVPQRNATFYNAPRPPYRPRPFNALPPGWHLATSGGSTYYYNDAGDSTWTRPMMPAAQVQTPPPPPKAVPGNKALEDIINRITSNKANTPKASASASTTPQPMALESNKDHKSSKEKWRTYSEEKQKKIYENTLFPHIKHVMDKFKTKLPKDDLKRFAKEISKKLVNSDFKNHRIEDPNRISSKQEKHIKKFVKEYFDKAVAKKLEHDKKKAEHKETGAAAAASPTPLTEPMVKKEADESDGGQGMEMSDGEPDKEKDGDVTPATPMDQITNGEGLKRKRGDDDDDSNGINPENDEATPSKRPRSETPPPPPPPPPPPTNGGPPGEATFSNPTTPVDELMMDRVGQGGYDNLEQAMESESPQDSQSAMKDSPMDNADLQQRPASFQVVQSRESNLTDVSDNAPSPSLVNASDMTPMESDNERDGERDRSFVRVDLERVLQLQVQDGA